MGLAEGHHLLLLGVVGDEGQGFHKGYSRPVEPLTLREAQRRVDEWIGRFQEGYFPPLLMLARLAEELGEVARVLAHRAGKKPKPGEEEGDLEEELGDLLFVLISLANREGLDLERAFLRAMAKYEARDGNRWTPR